jgi:hypothetical protein
MKQHHIPLADRDEFSRFVIDTIGIDRTRVSMLSPRTIYEVESLIGCLPHVFGSRQSSSTFSSGAVDSWLVVALSLQKVRVARIIHRHRPILCASIIGSWRHPATIVTGRSGLSLVSLSTAMKACAAGFFGVPPPLQAAKASTSSQQISGSASAAVAIGET